MSERSPVGATDGTGNAVRGVRSTLQPVMVRPSSFDFDRCRCHTAGIPTGDIGHSVLVTKRPSRGSRGQFGKMIAVHRRDGNHTNRVRGPARRTPDGSVRPSIFSASSAASISASRSIPVSMPMSCEHVHDLLGGHVAGGARRVRAAADPADARVELGDPQLQRGQHVGQRGTPGVVEVQQVRGGTGRRAGRGPGAGSPCRWCRRTRSGPRRRPRTRSTIAATRSGSMSPSNGQPKLVATITSTVAPASCTSGDQRGDVVERLVGRPVEVAPVVRVAGRHDDLDLAGSRRPSARCGAAGVGDQRRVAHRRVPADPAAHTSSASAICGIALGWTKRDRLDPPYAGAGQRVEQPDLGRRSGPASSFCSPSRGPTSRIDCTDAHRALHLIRDDDAGVVVAARRTPALSSSSAKNGRLFFGPAISNPATAARALAERVGPVGAVHDQLGHQRVVVRGDGGARRRSRSRPGRPSPVGSTQVGDRARAGQEPLRVLGVDPQLDRVPARRQRRPGRSVGARPDATRSCCLDQVDAVAPPR